MVKYVLSCHLALSLNDLLLGSGASAPGLHEESKFLAEVSDNGEGVLQNKQYREGIRQSCSCYAEGYFRLAKTLSVDVHLTKMLVRPLISAEFLRQPLQ